MVRGFVRPSGQVFNPKSASYDAKITSGNIVDTGADGQHRVNVEVISVKPLEYFWENS
jgi:hypothetical protein